MSGLDDAQRRELLWALQRMPPDADLLWDSDDVLRRFLPLPLHDRLFDRNVMIVRGARGTGKSMLFHVLRAMQERQLPLTAVFPRAQVERLTWIEGFAETGLGHPSTAIVEDFVRSATDVELRLFWSVHLYCRIMVSLPKFDINAAPDTFRTWYAKPNAIAEWVQHAEVNLADLTTAFDWLQKNLVKHEEVYFITYDHLDKIGLDDPTIRTRATSTLLSMWLSLSNRYRNLRPKIFVREDLFTQATHHSADASKLRGRSMTLTWDTQALYRLLVRHMAAESDALADWVRQVVPLDPREPLGLMPPDYLPEDGPVSQQRFVEHLVGKQIGRGTTAGAPHRWIPSRLQDAHGVIAPRSLLTLFAIAAEHALENGPRATGSRLLHPDELRAALEGTSRQHVNQTAEEHRVVARLENLRGAVLLLDPVETTERLATPRPGPEDGFGTDGAWVLDELLRIGVIRYRHDGRLDIPDIYRFAFGIKRKGGVARPK